VRIIEGGVNNLPDDNSHRASNEIANLLSSLTENDLVLALISGKIYNCFYIKLTYKFVYIVSRMG